ncbi:hypothetical protein N656DRAFT_107240 [Canariomyces notabilis]|uniref:Uncharacterized protein n=1 Tax=Canariomyces notabilis TaxID=2074819 RepID=A0AAN6TCV9_9PEZI|nr:hypothetical protein N656DRAFT_107240 [Canariomyces arenarius]
MHSLGEWQICCGLFALRAFFRLGTESSPTIASEPLSSTKGFCFLVSWIGANKSPFDLHCVTLLCRSSLLGSRFLACEQLHDYYKEDRIRGLSDGRCRSDRERGMRS